MTDTLSISRDRGEIRETSRLDKDAPCLLTTDRHLLQANANVYRSKLIPPS